jgi:hypothetical protein
MFLGVVALVPLPPTGHTIVIPAEIPWALPGAQVGVLFGAQLPHKEPRGVEGVCGILR